MLTPVTSALLIVATVTVPTEPVAIKLSDDNGTTCDVNIVTGPTVPVPAIPVTATFGAVPIIVGSVTPPVAAIPVGVTSIPAPSLTVTEPTPPVAAIPVGGAYALIIILVPVPTVAVTDNPVTETLTPLKVTTV